MLGGDHHSQVMSIYRSAGEQWKLILVSSASRNRRGNMSTRRQILTAILFSAAAWAQGPAAPPHNKSLLASEFPGADCGAKINAALTALAGPGEVLVPATRTRCPRGTTSCTTVPWIPRRPKAFCCTRIETRRPELFRRFLGRQPAVWRLVFLNYLQ